MRLGSAGLLALLWSFSSSNIATASPLADDAKAMPGLRPRQGSGTGSTPTSTTSVASTPTTSEAAEATTTITDTVTVGGGSGGTVTVTSNFLRTVITTVVVTTTTFETTTVTSNDVATATLTEYVTSTILAKRWINFLPAETAPFAAPAAQQITPAADLRKHAVIEKRAIVTVFVTVTGTAGADATVTNVRTSTVVRTTTSNLVQTSTIISTLFNNAQTTITVTSTLLVTSTSVDTTSAATVDTGPTTGNIATATDSGTSATGSSDSGSGDGGLSTGAKAGIGAGVGVVGLALLLGIGWWLYKRHKANRPSAADLADMRAYDPNGPSYDHGHGMSETGAGLGAAAATTPTHRRQPVPRKSSQLSPPTQSVSPMSNQTVSPADDYGSGYARPANGANELGGTRILPPEMGGDEVVEMGDGQPRPQQQRQHMTSFQSGPVPDVYEMPAQNYR